MRGRSSKNPPTPWAGGSCAVFLRGVDGGDPDFFQLRAFAGRLCIFPEKKNTDRPEGQSVFLVGEDGFPLTGINFDSIFHAKKNTNHPKRVIGIFGGAEQSLNEHSASLFSTALTADSIGIWIVFLLPEKLNTSRRSSS